MKAILIVDIPNEMINDTTCVTITSLHSGMSFNAKLKPMPQKMEYKTDGYAKYNYKKGYNDCIDELLISNKR